MIQYFLESRYSKNLYIFSSVLGPWSEWSQCSVTCGGGKQRRNRECGLPKTRSNQNNPCQAPLSEEQNCNDKNCPILTPWTDWSDCSKTCGGGYRQVTILNKYKFQSHIYQETVTSLDINPS